ncbi:DUF4145 domain-containing protein [Haemophilus influenzae]|nr:DUF4145 domain-containing protein [Haemophilus influenzae]MCK9080434.1 DUF4145 domain-containing protein [Haemophilus influenzae]MCK9117841.1 DUF4145 domain-containing protein [Haemophilus influenzae]
MITFSHDCPYCKKKNVAFEVGDFGRREQRNTSYDVIAILGTCNNCGGGIVTNVKTSRFRGDLGYGQSESEHIQHILEKHHGEKYSLEEILPRREFVFYPQPPKPEIPEYLPSDLEHAFVEAEDLYGLVEENKFIKQAGSSYRAIIELALSKLDNNPQDKNLNQRINQLADQGKLSPSMKDFAHRIRTLGNGASHALLEFSHQDLEDIRLFTRLFLIYAFTLPAMIPKEES